MERATADEIAAAGPRRRDEWVDTLRGLSVVLVILNHAVAFAFVTVEDAPAGLIVVNDILAPLRMPLMLFLSGTLVLHSLGKGSRPYLVGKMRKVLHPYLVWSALMVAVLAAATFVIGRPFDASYPLRIFYDPIEHLWFLAYLFLYYVVALVTRQVNPLIIVGLGIVAAFAASGDKAEGFFYLLSSFMMGVSVARYRSLWNRVLVSRASFAIAVAALGGLVIVAPLPGSVFAPSYFPLAVAGFVGACALAQRTRGRCLGPLRYVGRESIVFYVVHWPALLVILAVVTRVGQLTDLAAFLVALAGALFVSTAVAIAARRVKAVHWLFSA